MTFIQNFYAWLKRPNKSKFAQYVETFVIIVPLAFVIRTYFYGLYKVPTGSMETTMLVGEGFVADKFTNLFWPIQYGDIVSFNDPDYPYSENKFLNIWQRYVGPYPYLTSGFPFIRFDWGPSNWTKRVIGLPGDHIEGKMEDGKPVVYRNGQKLDEPYVNQYPLLIACIQSSGHCDYRSYDPNKPYNQQPFYSFDKHSVDLAKRILENVDEKFMKMPFTPAFDRFGRNGDIYDIHLGTNQYWVMGDNRLGSYDARFWGSTGKPLDGTLIHGRIKFRLWSVDSTEPWLIMDIVKHPFAFWKRVRWDRFLQKVQ